jgi:hypothetical protein
MRRSGFPRVVHSPNVEFVRAGADHFYALTVVPPRSTAMAAAVDTAIIGAGPYGLSLAAHLRARSASFRIFGPALETWRRHMPKGMMLKSDGFASDLSSCCGDHSLGKYCRDRNIAYHDTAIPVSLATFTNYAEHFQVSLVPNLESKRIAHLAAGSDGYLLHAEDGEQIRARNVVVAVGISYSDYLPRELRGLSESLVTHSSSHHDLEPFRGRDVLVVGAGASAVDLAVLLYEQGATVRLAARAPRVPFASEPSLNPPSRWRRLRHPKSGLGPGLRSRFYADAPGLFRYFPERLRRWIVGRHLGPSSPWRLKKSLTDNVPVFTGYRLAAARVCGDRVKLEFHTPAECRAVLECDHVIAATGYRGDLSRVSFIDRDLYRSIPVRADLPVLSANFESVRGLYFIGPLAVNTFGPLMRFMYGDAYAARKVAAHLTAHR